MKQVLAEFQQMQKQLLCDGIVEVRVYKSDDYWTIKVQVTTFTEDCEIKTRDYVEWTHYSRQGEENEQNNEWLLAEFKERFGLNSKRGEII